MCQKVIKALEYISIFVYLQLVFILYDLYFMSSQPRDLTEVFTDVWIWIFVRDNCKYLKRR